MTTRGVGATRPTGLARSARSSSSVSSPSERCCATAASPVHEEPVDGIEQVALDPVSREVPVESLGAGVFEQVFVGQRRLARRRELELVHAFREWFEGQAVAASGLLIPYAPERRNLRADLYLPGAHTLFEAKASASREYVRAAISQLLDYRRWIEPRPRLCVLVPTEVPDDMVSPLASLSIGVAWSCDDGFVVHPGGLLRPADGPR